MNAVPAISQIPQPPSETATVIHMIERAARDPSVSLDRLTQLLELRDRMELQRAKRAYTEAMAQAQEEMRPISADASNPQTKSRYASLIQVDRAIRPIYTRHGFYPSFNTAKSEKGDEWVKVTCEVAHRDGHSREYAIDMPTDGKGAKGGDVMTKTHATGSAVTYGRRYLLLMIFNLAVGEVDDDGNAAGGENEFISETQASELKKLIEDTGGSVEKFCAFAQVEKLGDIYASRFEAAKAAINRASAARKAKANADR